jgi:hypothetical protein
VTAALHSVGTRELAEKLIPLYDSGGEGKTVALNVMDALGPTLSDAFASLLCDAHPSVSQRTMVAMLCQKAPVHAPAMVAALARCPDSARPLFVRILGFAGPGYETVVEEQFLVADEKVTREVLRALARIGSPLAAELVAARVHDRRAWLADSALESLWRFPPHIVKGHVLSLLANRAFVVGRPIVAMRLLNRLGRYSSDGAEHVLRSVWALRYRVWKPAVVRVARRAGAMLRE